MRAITLVVCMFILYPQLAIGTPIKIEFDGTLSSFSGGQPEFNVGPLLSDIGSIGDIFYGEIRLDPEDETVAASMSVSINGKIFSAGNGLTYSMIDDVTGDFFLFFRDFSSVTVSSPVTLSNLDMRVNFEKAGDAGTVNEFPSEFNANEWRAYFNLFGLLPIVTPNSIVSGQLANISVSPVAAVNSPQNMFYFVFSFAIYFLSLRRNKEKRLINK